MFRAHPTALGPLLRHVGTPHRTTKSTQGTQKTSERRFRGPADKRERAKKRKSLKQPSQQLALSSSSAAAASSSPRVGYWLMLGGRGRRYGGFTWFFGAAASAPAWFRWRGRGRGRQGCFLLLFLLLLFGQSFSERTLDLARRLVLVHSVVPRVLVVPQQLSGFNLLRCEQPTPLILLLVVARPKFILHRLWITLIPRLLVPPQQYYAFSLVGSQLLPEQVFPGGRPFFRHGGEVAPTSGSQRAGGRGLARVQSSVRPR
jgi:hypothetical protein